MRVFTGIKNIHYQFFRCLAQLVLCGREMRKSERRKEMIRLTTNQLRLGELRETQRKNKVQEQLGYSTLAESRRHNIAAEKAGMTQALASQLLAEAQTPYYKASADKLASEVGVAAATQEEEKRWHDLQDAVNQGKLDVSQEQIDLGLANLDELIRHNQVSEDISRWRSRFENAESIGHLIRDGMAGVKSLSDLADTWLVSTKDVTDILARVLGKPAADAPKSNGPASNRKEKHHG